MSPESVDLQEARAQADAAEQELIALERDPSTPRAILEAAENRFMERANIVLGVTYGDKAQAKAEATQDRVAVHLNAPYEASLANVVRLLTEYGPLDTSQIEARRIPGASKSAVRGILRDAEDRGLVGCHMSGRRKMWTAVISGGVASPTRGTPRGYSDTLGARESAEDDA